MKVVVINTCDYGSTGKIMLDIAHTIKERSEFLWDAIEWVNALAFSMMYSMGLKRIPVILQEHFRDFTMRFVALDDVRKKLQEEMFKTNGFDEKSLKKIVADKTFISFLVRLGETITGCFSLKSLINGDW